MLIKSVKFADVMKISRGVAQLGSARRSGRRGRRFKSGYPDKTKNIEYQHIKELFTN